MVIQSFFRVKIKGSDSIVFKILRPECVHAHAYILLTTYSKFYKKQCI